MSIAICLSTQQVLSVFATTFARGPSPSVSSSGGQLPRCGHGLAGLPWHRRTRTCCVCVCMSGMCFHMMRSWTCSRRAHTTAYKCHYCRGAQTRGGVFSSERRFVRHVALVNSLHRIPSIKKHVHVASAQCSIAARELSSFVSQCQRMSASLGSATCCSIVLL